MPKCFKQCFIFSSLALTCMPSTIKSMCPHHHTKTKTHYPYHRGGVIHTPALRIYHSHLSVPATHIHTYTYHAATVSSETTLVIYMLVITAGAVHYVYIQTYLPSLTHDMYVRMCYIHTYCMRNQAVYIHTNTYTPEVHCRSS